MSNFRLLGNLAFLLCSAVGQAQDLYVASLNTNQVLAYSGTTGAFLGVFASGGGLSGPARLVFGPGGNLYVTSFYSNQVLKYDGNTGAFLSDFVTVGSGGLAHPVGLTFGPDGNLYVCSSGTHQVLKYDGVTGAFIGVFVDAGSGVSNAGPADLTFGLDRNLYVLGADFSTGAGSVLEYDGSTGAFIRIFVSLGSGGINDPQEVVFNPRDGNLYVTNDTNEVLEYDGTTGSFSRAFVSAGSGGLSAPGAMAFGPDGNVYVNSYSTSQVLKYDGFTGAFLGAFVGAGSGGLNGSQGLAFSPPKAHLYNVCLLYDPTKAVKSGAAIPIKLQLCDSNRNDLSSSSITVHAISISQISTSISGQVENPGDSNPDNNFRFDATLGSTGGYIFNFKTTGLSTGTYRVNFTVTGDSFVYAVNFQVK